MGAGWPPSLIYSQSLPALEGNGTWLSVGFSAGTYPVGGHVLPICRGQQPLFQVICYNDDDYCWMIIVAHWQDYS